MLSREMNLLLIPHGRFLRVADPGTGAWLPTEAEEQQQRADALQNEVERLRALLDQRHGLGNGKRNGPHSS